MHSDCPRTRRTFSNRWDEVLYLYDKILYWLYGKQNRSRAMRFAGRLQELLRRLCWKHEAIRGEECWSLLYELKGDLRRAIKYRENEIRLIKGLRQSARPIKDSRQKKWILHGYGISDLSDRMDLLALLYDRAGNTGKAIGVLRNSKRLCKKHGVRFDGQDILDELLTD